MKLRYHGTRWPVSGGTTGRFRARSAILGCAGRLPVGGISGHLLSIRVLRRLTRWKLPTVSECKHLLKEGVVIGLFWLRFLFASQAYPLLGSILPWHAFVPSVIYRERNGGEINGVVPLTNVCFENLSSPQWLLSE